VGTKEGARDLERVEWIDLPGPDKPLRCNSIKGKSTPRLDPYQFPAILLSNPLPHHFAAVRAPESIVRASQDHPVYTTPGSQLEAAACFGSLLPPLTSACLLGIPVLLVRAVLLTAVRSHLTLDGNVPESESGHKYHDRYVDRQEE